MLETENKEQKLRGFERNKNNWPVIATIVCMFAGMIAWIIVKGG